MSAILTMTSLLTTPVPRDFLRFRVFLTQCVRMMIIQMIRSLPSILPRLEDRDDLIAQVVTKYITEGYRTNSSSLASRPARPRSLASPQLYEIKHRSRSSSLPVARASAASRPKGGNAATCTTCDKRDAEAEGSRFWTLANAAERSS